MMTDSGPLFPFLYRDGWLAAVGPEGSQDISKAVAFPVNDRHCEVDFTPTYIYNLHDVELRARRYQAALAPGGRAAPAEWTHTVHFAMKANHSPGVLRTVLAAGAGLDTVSWGEIETALRAGAKPSQVIFSGVGKTVLELGNAIESRIKQINCESEAELTRILRLAQRRRSGLEPVPVALRLNPDVNPETHKYIATGFRDNKFGIDEVTCLRLAKELLRHQADVRLVGLTMHIGSQLLSNQALLQAAERLAELTAELITMGHPVARIDVGGGLGIDYSSNDVEPEFARLDDYGNRLRPLLAAVANLAQLSAPLEVMSEPGRFIVARAGALITRVEYIKEHHVSAGGKRFAVVNTGLHHLLRPALYEARHRVVPLKASPAGMAALTYDVVGPICESSDVLAREVSLSSLHEGDGLAILDAGAYGSTMASDYNLHPRPREVDTFA